MFLFASIGAGSTNAAPVSASVSTGRTASVKGAPVIRCAVKTIKLIGLKNVSATGGCSSNNRAIPSKGVWTQVVSDNHGFRCDSRPFGTGVGRSFSVQPLGGYKAIVTFRFVPQRKVKGRLISLPKSRALLLGDWTTQCGVIPKDPKDIPPLCPWSMSWMTHCGVPQPGTCSWVSPPTFDPKTRAVISGSHGCPSGSACTYNLYKKTTWFGYQVQLLHYLACGDKMVTVGVQLIRLFDTDPTIDPNAKPCEVIPIEYPVPIFTVPPTWRGYLEVAFMDHESNQSQSTNPYVETETGGPWHLTGSVDGCPELLKLPHVPTKN